MEEVEAEKTKLILELTNSTTTDDSTDENTGDDEPEMYRADAVAEAVVDGVANKVGSAVGDAVGEAAVNAVTGDDDDELTSTDVNPRNSKIRKAEDIIKKGEFFYTDADETDETFEYG